MILRRQQSADIALKHEVWPVRALDGFEHLWVSSVDEIANLPADGLLPIGQTIDVDINAWVGRIGHGSIHHSVCEVSLARVFHGADRDGQLGVFSRPAQLRSSAFNSGAPRC